MGDPVTGPLGVAIGLPGLVFTCVQYYDTVQSYLKSKAEFGVYVPLFGWEYHRFADWKKQVMPDGKNILIEDIAIENLTIACLDQITNTFQQVEKFSDRYGMQRVLDWATRRKSLKEEIKDISRIRKMAWSLEGSKSAERLCRTLRSYNDALDGIWKRSQSSVARRLLPELDGINSVSGLTMIEEALKREEGTEYRELASAVRFRRRCLEVKLQEASGSEQMDPVRLSRSLQLKYEDFPRGFFINPSSHPSTVVKGENVLIEWKTYSSQAPPSVNQHRYGTMVSQNIMELAKILAESSKPRRLRALDCVGYYDCGDEGPLLQVCFAFKSPQGLACERISLHSLIENGQTYEEGRFYLGDQFTLAQELASAVYQLHFSGWVHKQIRSSNIYFFKPSTASHAWRAHPKESFLMGYGFSRMIDTSSLSNKPDQTSDSERYTHPEYLGGSGTNFKPLYDIYSLGIVLIEIALWKTAKQIATELNTNPARSEISLAQWRVVVPNMLIPLVERNAGRVYTDAVRRCIQGNFGDQWVHEDLATLLKALDGEVVAKLEKCYA